MRIAITGGAGFIASNVADAYQALGHELLVVDDLSSGRESNVPRGATLVRADVRSPAAAEAIERFRPEVLNVHAAQIDVRRSVADPRLDAEVNVLGGLNCVEAARRGGALSRVVYAASGGSMYGDVAPLPTSEGAPPAPVSPYGVSKAAFELYLGCWRALYGLHFVALRYANVYGPRQNPHGEAGVVAIFTDRLLASKECVIYGDGGQTRDFVHVYDVVDANVRALTTPFSGGVNVATGVETSISRVYELLAKAAKVVTPARLAPGKPGEQRQSVLSPAKAKAELGWTPKYDVERGLAQTVEWAQSHQSR